MDRRGMDIRLTESGKPVSEKEVEPEHQESFFDCLNEEETNNPERLSGTFDSKNLEEKTGRGWIGPFPGSDFRAEAGVTHSGGVKGDRRADFRGLGGFLGKGPSPISFGERDAVCLLQGQRLAHSSGLSHTKKFLNKTEGFIFTGH